MPSDLTQLFAQLRREPMATVFASPETLRLEGTRRRRVRRAAVAGLAAAGVAVVAVTLTAVLPTPTSMVPPPGIIGSPTATTAEPTRTGPTPRATTPTVTTGPGPIPVTAFPADSELRFEYSEGTGIGLPEMCGAMTVPTPDLVASRSGGSYIDVPDPPGQNAPEGSMGVGIALYSDGGASRFMAALRDALITCPVDPDWMDGIWGPLTFAAIVGSTYGDETISFIASHETPIAPDSTATYTCQDLYEVVRVGDAVHAAEVHGWETCNADPALDRRLRDSAIDAFIDWATTL
jgi:hypothetical protein